jgi:dimethylhistidine N-methyltransferase
MTRRDEFAADVRAGLGGAGPKTLAPRWFYDEVGSALFDAICGLPEYGLWRAGSRVLRASAVEIATTLVRPLRVAELGSGSGRNTRTLLEAIAAIAPIAYHPIDVSTSALARCAADLAALPGVEATPVEDTYLSGLGRVADARRDERLLVLFLGGTIGNFDRTSAGRFLAEVRGRLRAGDHLLLAADLDKPASVLLPAYDDALGVTAAFNKNVLARINRELGGDFDLGRFDHVVRWDERERRIEMHLRARVDHQVHVRDADLRAAFRAGETVWTESSYRFSLDEIDRVGREAGFACDRTWVDAEWPFVQALWRVR